MYAVWKAEIHDLYVSDRSADTIRLSTIDGKTIEHLIAADVKSSRGLTIIAPGFKFNGKINLFDIYKIEWDLPSGLSIRSDITDGIAYSDGSVNYCEFMQHLYIKEHDATIIYIDRPIGRLIPK